MQLLKLRNWLTTEKAVYLLILDHAYVTGYFLNIILQGHFEVTSFDGILLFEREL